MNFICKPVYVVLPIVPRTGQKKAKKRLILVFKVQTKTGHEMHVNISDKSKRKKNRCMVYIQVYEMLRVQTKQGMQSMGCKQHRSDKSKI